MKKKILRNVYVDYKVNGHIHINHSVGSIDFKLSEITEEDYTCQQEPLAEFWGAKKEDVEIIKFHF